MLLPAKPHRDAAPPTPPSPAGLERRRVLFVTDCYQEEVLVGIAGYAGEANWNLNANMRLYGELPRTTEAEGILAGIHRERVRDWLQGWKGCPIVRIDSTPFDLPYRAIELEYSSAGRDGARHLLELGHVHFAFYSIYTIADAPDSQRLWLGFAAELAERGLHAHRVELAAAHPGRNVDAIPREKREAWLARELQGLPRPFAIMGDDDRRSLELLGACEIAGLRVPEDVSILGCGNQALELATARLPSSSVDLNLQGMGRAAAVLLDRLMSGEKPSEDVLTVPPRGVVARQSTATFVTDSAGVTAAVLHLRAHFREPLRVARLARIAGRSLRGFQAEFKRCTGFTVREELQRVRLAHVACLLRDTDLKLDAIAVESGFRSGNYLAEAFYEAHGVRPNAWRLAARNA